MLSELSIRAAVTTREVWRRMSGWLEEAQQRPDRGDISITTVIIWVAAVTAAVGMAGAIAFVVNKYANDLRGT